MRKEEFNKTYLQMKRDLFDRFYQNLNESQRQAVYAVNGPLLILAGAGSGKTTVLANRIAHIIRFGNAYESNTVPNGLTEEALLPLQEQLLRDVPPDAAFLQRFTEGACPPWAIMSITFTNKAAKEMQERLTRTVGTTEDGSGADDVWAGTFHSICLRILRRYSEAAGLRPGFTIYDTDDTKKLISAIMRDLAIDEKMMPVKSLIREISAAKDKLWDAAAFEREANDYRTQKIAQIYSAYQTRMREANALDFDDIILRTVTLLGQNEDARNYYQHRFRYICVDEYQDTNHAQFELIRLLAGYHHNLMVVGDDDQSIYKFRGARIENILNFETNFTEARVIRLEQNYRSTQYILDGANAIISHNLNRKGKTLFTNRGNGEKITVHRLENQLEEAKYIVSTIEELIRRDSRAYRDFAVLYRMNAQSNSLEQVFSRSGIPYRVLGGLRFYERKEIKDVIAYLCVVANPTDDLRLKRIINEPKRKIGETTVNAIETLAKSEHVSMLEIMAHADRYRALERSAVKLMDFARLIATLQEITRTEPLPTVIDKTLELSGYQDMLIAAGEAEHERLENVQELISNAVEYMETREAPTLQSFLEEIALVADVDNYDRMADAVVLMTIHSAKGLEFPVVFLPGCEEGIFPGSQSAMYPEDLEEERRLAYVAVTRAKDRLYCLHTQEHLLYGRTQFNPPSRFLDELPGECVIADPAEARRPNPLPRAVGRPKPQVSPELLRSPGSSQYRPPAFAVTFRPGDTVLHATFGRGEVLAARDLGGDILYEIAFESCGTKKLMATYARLTPAKDLS